MKNNLFTGIVFCVFSLAGYAQEPAENLGSDRPGATFSANTVGQWVLQVQSGVDYTHLNFDPIKERNENNQPINISRIDEIMSTATDVRFGFYKTFEVGFSLLTTSMRTRVKDESGSIPAYRINQDPSYDLMPSLRANAISTERFQLGLMVSYLFLELNPDVFISRVMGAYSFNEKTGLSANLSHENQISTSGQDVYGYTLNLGHSFNKLTFFVENYGGLAIFNDQVNGQNRFSHFFNLGAYYLITPNIQLDCTVNLGDNGQILFTNLVGVQQTGASLGLTWRFFAN